MLAESLVRKTNNTIFTQFAINQYKAYVCGFLFSENKKVVALIRKNRPTWQAGKLNGIGGKIENFETPLQAMEREFFEETGVNIFEWRQFAVLSGNDSDVERNANSGTSFKVYFFVAFSDGIYDANSTTDEEIKAVALEDLEDYLTLPNLDWLIPMALSMENESINHFDILEKIA